jgi:hypothetical protein
MTSDRIASTSRRAPSRITPSRLAAAITAATLILALAACDSAKSNDFKPENPGDLNPSAQPSKRLSYSMDPATDTPPAKTDAAKTDTSKTGTDAKTAASGPDGGTPGSRAAISAAMPVRDRTAGPETGAWTPDNIFAATGTGNGLAATRCQYLARGAKLMTGGANQDSAPNEANVKLDQKADFVVVEAGTMAESIRDKLTRDYTNRGWQAEPQTLVVPVPAGMTADRQINPDANGNLNYTQFTHGTQIAYLAVRGSLLIHVTEENTKPVTGTQTPSLGFGSKLLTMFLTSYKG